MGRNASAACAEVAMSSRWLACQQSGADDPGGEQRKRELTRICGLAVSEMFGWAGTLDARPNDARAF